MLINEALLAAVSAGHGLFWFPLFAPLVRPVCAKVTVAKVPCGHRETQSSTLSHRHPAASPRQLRVRHIHIQHTGKWDLTVWTYLLECSPEHSPVLQSILHQKTVCSFVIVCPNRNIFFSTSEFLVSGQLRSLPIRYHIEYILVVKIRVPPQVTTVWWGADNCVFSPSQPPQISNCFLIIWRHLELYCIFNVHRTSTVSNSPWKVQVGYNEA